MPRNHIPAVFLPLFTVTCANGTRFPHSKLPTLKFRGSLRVLDLQLRQRPVQLVIPVSHAKFVLNYRRVGIIVYFWELEVQRLLLVVATFPV